MPPSVSTLRESCCNVSVCLHSGQLGSSLSFHLSRFVGVGSRSYTDLRRMESWRGSYCQSSCHVSFLSGKFPRFQLPCWPIWTDLADRCVSSDLLISCCTILRLSWLSALFHRGCCPCPSTSRPLLVAASMTWCCRLLSACSTALVTDHFLPVLTSIPALLTFLSSESRY